MRYRDALAIDGEDPYLLGAFADWLLDQGRAGEVIALLGERTRVDPLLLRLALAEQTTSSPHLAGHIADLAARFEASRLRGDSVHRREEARFALHLEHASARALDLARANWAVQREPADARILLEAATAAGQPQAADPCASGCATIASRMRACGRSPRRERHARRAIDADSNQARTCAPEALGPSFSRLREKVARRSRVG